MLVLLGWMVTGGLGDYRVALPEGAMSNLTGCPDHFRSVTASLGGSGDRYSGTSPAA
jgi:hypothetical protein